MWRNEEGNLKFVVFLVRHPCIVILLSLGLSVVLSIAAISQQIGSGDDLFSTPRSDGDIGHVTSINDHALALGMSYVRDAKGKSSKSSASEVQPKLSQLSDVLILVFEASGDNVFSRDMLEQSKEIENKLINDPEFPEYCQRDRKLIANDTLSPREKCELPMSPLNLFFASDWDQTRMDKAVNVVRSIDDFSNKAKEVLICTAQVPKDFIPLVAGMSLSVYHTGLIPSDLNMTEPEILQFMNGFCPDLKATNVTEVGYVFGVVMDLVDASTDFDGKGTLNDPEKVMEVCAVLLEIPILRPLVEFYFDKNFAMDNLKSKFGRLLIKYGQPLEGYNNVTDRETDQSDKYKEWFQLKFRDYLQGDATISESFKVYYLSTALIFDEILAIMITDALFALFSITFVFSFLVGQTGSFFLAIAGMIEIIMSLPLAFAFYSMLLQFDYLASFCSMCIFIVLAIGADDIFVFMDAYKQSAFEGPEVLQSFESRLSWVYSRAASAMLITSFTTMAAFVATAFSPLSTVQSFGIYAACVILADFILVITFFPACLVIYHRNMELRGCCGSCRCCAKQGLTSTELYASAKQPPPRRPVEEFIKSYMVPFICKFKFPLIAVFAVWTIINVIVSLKIEAATAADQFLPEDHPFQRMTTIQSTEFLASDYTPIYLTWGIKGVDRTGVNLLYDKDYLGEPIFDDAFELDSAGQNYIYKVCRDLSNQPFVARDRDDPLKGSYDCFVEDFRDWAMEKGHGFPVSNFNQLLPSFLNQTTRTEDGLMTFSRKYGNSIGFVDGDLKYFSVTFLSLMDAHAFYSREFLTQKYNEMEDYAKKINDEAPDTVKNMAQSDERDFWVRMRNQEIYISSAITGSLVGTALAFFVILIATRCILVATFAALSIAGILLSVLAFMVGLGWQLGTIESINITILAGFSVDYVVHLAHAYMVSKADTSHGRVEDALGEIGISVLCGMMTSVGAAVILFLCQLQFFAKFGAFLCSTIAFSWIWANFFFMALLAAFGPVSKQSTGN